MTLFPHELVNVFLVVFHQIAFKKYLWLNSVQEVI